MRPNLGYMRNGRRDNRSLSTAEILHSSPFWLQTLGLHTIVDAGDGESPRGQLPDLGLT
jgi:hypothetical protein